MKIPLVVYLAFLAYFVPLATAIVRWRHLPLGHRFLVGWLCAIQFTSVAQRVSVKVFGATNNLVLSYVSLPVQMTFVLLALAEFQLQPAARRTVRYCIPVLLLWWGVAFAFLEDHANFSVYGTPVLGMIALAAALFAFVSHLQSDREPLTQASWAWVLASLAIFFATNATITILQSVLTSRQDWPMLVRTAILKAYIDILAMLILTGGFLWARPTRSFGTSSSPSPSP
ncbi:MAG: hypothetical protein IT357_10830 [Gemmatimonadaceae bacterium]|nr:hypothetical protein [Gemmatimonadaceae bacterium]